MCLKKTLRKLIAVLAMSGALFVMAAEQPQSLPVSVEREVAQSQMVTFRYHVRMPNLPRANRCALVSFFFTNSRGDLLKPDSLPFAQKLGGWAYVNADAPCFSGEKSVIAPGGAVKVRIVLSSWPGNAKMQVEKFDAIVRDLTFVDYFNSVALVRLYPWLALLLFCLAVAVSFRFYGHKRLEDEPVSLFRRVVASLVAGAVVAFATLSLGTSLVYNAVSLWDLSFFIDAMAFLFVLFLVLGGFKMLEERGGCFATRHPVVVMGMFFLCVHAMVIQLVDGHLKMLMSSDFYEVQRCLESSKIVVAHNPIFSYWCNHELLLSVLGKIFGPHLQVGQYLNVLCCIGVLYPVFRLVEQVSGRRFATLVAFLVGAYPTNYIYSTLLTSEYLCAFFLIWALHFLVCAKNCIGDRGRSAVLISLCGLSLGAAQIAKPFSPVFLAAAMVMMLVLVTRIRCRANWRLVVGGLLLLSVYLAVAKYVQGVYSQIAEPQKVCVAGGNLKQTLVKGLDFEGGGRCSVANAKLVKSMSDAETTEYLKKAVKRDFREYPHLFAKKFARVHSGEKGILDWFSVSVKAQLPKLPRWLVRLVENYYLLFRILFFLGAWGFCCTPLRSRMRLQPGMFSAAFVSGFAVLLMIVEAHGRYRVPVYPFAFVMLAYLDAWLDKDNPTYVSVRNFGQSLVRRLRRKPKGGGMK